MKNTRFADMVTGIGLMLLAAYWFFEANKMPKVDLGIGSGGYPMFVSAGLFIMGLLLFLQNVIKGLPKPDFKIEKKAVLRMVLFVVVTIVYVQAMRYLGFILLTPPYMFFACCLFGYRKKVIAVIASIVITALLIVVFRVFFFVPLPEFRLF